MDKAFYTARILVRFSPETLTGYPGGHWNAVPFVSLSGWDRQDRLRYEGNVSLTPFFFCSSFFESLDSDLRIVFGDPLLGNWGLVPDTGDLGQLKPGTWIGCYRSNLASIKK